MGPVVKFCRIGLKRSIYLFLCFILIFPSVAKGELDISPVNLPVNQAIEPVIVTPSVSANATTRFLIKYKRGTADITRENPKTAHFYKAKTIKKLGRSEFELIVTSKPTDKDTIISDLRTLPEFSDIEYIQPDYAISMVSNDSYYNQQWGIDSQFYQGSESIELPGDEKTTTTSPQYSFDANVVPAWDESLGQGVCVAVIDSGIDITHEDLHSNIWVNAMELPGNGIDDDDNGYIDDIWGWNFSGNDNLIHDPQNMSDEWHGTHIAGIIAAQKDNGIGIAGVAPEAQIMSLKAFKNGTAYTSDIINAIQYASQMGATIVNCSWGSSQYNQALFEVIQSHPEILFIAAAGNNGQDLSSYPVYPASYQLDNVITVASFNQSAAFSAFSNYNADVVDIAAPGEEIISTLPDNDYGPSGGTSMAAAFVSAEAALVSAANEELSSLQIKTNIINGCDRLSSLIGKVNNHSKINCYNAVTAIDSSNSPITQVAANNSGSTGSDFPHDSEYHLYSIPQWQSVANMSAGRANVIAVQCKGKIYAMGGYVKGGVTGKMEMYDPAADTWTTKASLPIPRASFAATVLDNKIYVLGGADDNGTDLNSMYVYNPDTNVWTARANLPQAVRGLGACNLNGKIYALGGVYYDTRWENDQYISTVSEYDPTTNTWTYKASMSTARTVHVGAVNGKIYAIGGGDGDRNLNLVEEYDPIANVWHTRASMPTTSNNLYMSSSGAIIYGIHGSIGVVEAYDPYKDEWSTLTPVNAYGNMGAVVAGGKLYGIGGRSTSSSTVYSWVRTLDIEPGAWNPRPYMPSKRISFGASTLNNFTYVIGGYNNGFLDTVEQYNSNNGVWVGRTNMPTARAALGVAEINGKFYAIGGYNGSQYLNTVEEYEHQADTWATKSSMPTARGDAGIVSCNGKVYAIGGYNGTYLSTVEEYDPVTDTWTAKASMPTPRCRMAVTVNANKIYVLGGFYNGWLDTVEEFDPANNTWTVRENMLAPRDQFGAVTVNGTIFAIGGYSDGQYYGDVMAYNVQDNTWQYRVSMPTPRYKANVVSVNNKILAIGGCDTRVLTRVEEYDPAKNESEPEKWTQKANMPSARYELGAAEAGGKIYALGGSIDDTYYNKKALNEVYDFETDSWSTVRAMPEARYGLGCASVDNKIFVVAGAVPAGITRSTIMYDPSTNTWSSKASCTGYHRNPGTAVIDGKIYVIGGIDSNITEVYDPVNNTWTAKANLPAIVSKLGAVSCGGKIYVIGGQDTNNNPLNTVYEYDPQTDTWTGKQNMPKARYGLVAVNIGGLIYAMGGSDGAGCLDVIEAYNPITDSWSTEGSMPEAKALMSCITTNDRAYLIGGLDSSGVYQYVHEFNPGIIAPQEQAPNSWQLASSMTAPREKLAAAAINESVYAVGGINAGTTLASVEKYDSTVDDWSAVASLNIARHSLGLASLNGKLYAAGGTDGSSHVGTLEAYDPLSNTWTPKTDMLASRSELALAPVNGKLYAIGGYNGQNYLNAVEEYNPLSNSWRARAPMPTARSRLGATVINGKIYAIGGFNGLSNLNVIEEYDPTTNTWTTKTAMTIPRQGAGICSLNGRIFVGGGYNGAYLANLEVYDPIADIWEIKTDLTGARAYLSMAAVNGKVYAVGGGNASGALNLNEQYLPDRYRPSSGAIGPDTWIQMADMTSRRSGAGIVAVDGNIYAVGGERDQNDLQILEKFDLESNTWMTMTSMPTARSYAGIAALNGKIYVAGGENTSVLNQLEVYDPKTDSWTTKVPMPTTRSHLALVAWNNKIYALGGRNGAQHLATMEVYDPETNLWTTLSGMSVIRSGLTATVLNDQIYVVGGYDGMNYLDSVGRYDPDTGLWVSLTDMPWASADLGCLAVNGRIYAVGGYNGEYLSSMAEYDPASDTWTLKNDMLYARSGLGLAESGWDIYAIGGYDGTTHLNAVEKYTTLYDRYFYSDSNRLEEIRLQSGGVIHYEYDDNGSLINRTIDQN